LIQHIIDINKNIAHKSYGLDFFWKYNFHIDFANTRNMYGRHGLASIMYGINP
jgi:hypothetical protein